MILLLKSPNHILNLLARVAFFMVSVATIYFTFVVDKATVTCRITFQLMTQSESVKTVTYILLFESPTLEELQNQHHHY